MKLKKLALLFFIGMSSVFGQQKITVESIFTGAFRTKGMDALQAMNTTNQYTVLNPNQARNGQQIDLYDYASLKKVATLIDTKDFPQLSDGIDSYSFSEDEKQILIANNTQPIFRHSFTADYFLYNITSKQLVKLFDFPVQEPTLSPDGKKIAYAKTIICLFTTLLPKRQPQLLQTEKRIVSSTGLPTGCTKKNLLL